MADRTSARLFARFFTYLAKVGGGDALAEAHELWEEIYEYDFDYYQLGCDEALLVLGLARKGVHPDYPEDGETILYKGEAGFHEVRS